MDIQNGNPWQTIRDLRRELAQVRSSKASTDRMLADSLQRINELEQTVEEQKGLVERVAHLEAELSITRAELQMTTALAHETNPSSSNSTVTRTPIEEQKTLLHVSSR